MKVLKNKLGFLSLLTVLAVSIFLTSCEQKHDLDEVLIDYDKSEEIFYLEAPENMSDEEVFEWIEGLDYEELRTLAVSEPMESRSCGGWWYDYIIESRYQGCSCHAGLGRFAEKWAVHRFCNSGVQGSTLWKISCKSYC